MTGAIVIFAADPVRGQIILKSLQQNGLDALLNDKTVNAENILINSVPSVVILDTKDFFSKDLGFLKSSSHLLSEAALIVLADSSGTMTDEFEDLSNTQYLPDPLDTGLIVSRVKEILSSGERKDSLEDDLKHLLDLE